MKQNRTHRYLFFLPIFLMLAAAACQEQPVFLNLQMQDVYSTHLVNVYYSFRSEKVEQPCHLTIVRLDGNMDVILDEQRDLPQDGIIELDFNTIAADRPSGYYRITLTVLSAEGLSHQPIAYLSESRDFKVEL